MKYKLIIMIFSALILVLSCNKNDKSANKADSQQVNGPVSTHQLKKVLVVHSYHHDHEWVEGINRGIKIGLSDKPIQIEHFYMDTKYHTGLQWKQQKSEEVFDLIEKWQPDVLITVDDNAQKYVGSKLAGKKYPSVVFCGVNGDMAEYGYPAENVTGVLERPNFTESVEFLQDIKPGIKKVIVISDTGPTTDGTFKYMQQQNRNGVEVVSWKKIKTFGQWKNVVLESQHQVDAIIVYTYHTLKSENENEKSVNASKVMQWTMENSNLPVVGFLSFAVDNGTFCGVIESALDQGLLASEKAFQVLNGTPAGEIPVEVSVENQKMINLDVAEKLGLKIDEKVLEQTDILVGEY